METWTKKEETPLASVVEGTAGAVAVLLSLTLNYNDGEDLHGITLFKPEKLTENFRSLDQWFDSRKVAAGSAVSSFDYDLQDLPSSYVYKGHTKDVGQFIDETHTTGLVVTRNGSIVYEEYFRGNNDASRCILWSVSKSVVSALVGIAVDEGFIRDIHEPVTAYVVANHAL